MNRVEWFKLCYVILNKLTRMLSFSDISSRIWFLGFLLLTSVRGNSLIYAFRRKSCPMLRPCNWKKTTFLNKLKYNMYTYRISINIRKTLTLRNMEIVQNAFLYNAETITLETVTSASENSNEIWVLSRWKMHMTGDLSLASVGRSSIPN